MEKRNILPSLDAGVMLVLNIVVAVVTIIAAICYGPIGITNPFWVMCWFLTLRALLVTITLDFEDDANRDFKKNVIYGPLKVGVGVVLAWTAIPDPFILRVLIVGCAGWFLLSGLKSLNAASPPLFDRIQSLWENRSDAKSFRKHMKEVAETARLENELSSDLAGFLSGAGSAGAGKS